MTATGKNRVSRRRFAGSATAAVGVVAASGYVRPELRALGVPTAYAQVSTGPTVTTTPPGQTVTVTETTATPTATATGTVATSTPTGTPGTPTATGTPTTPAGDNNRSSSSNSSSSNSNSNSNGNSNSNQNSNDNGDPDGGDDFFVRRPSNSGSSLPGSTYPGVPPVLNSAPGGIPGVSPAQPPVLSAQPPRGITPVPPVLAQAPRPVPGVLPFAGQGWAEFPRWAAMAGLGLVGTGLGLRLRQRITGATDAQELGAVPPAAETPEERPFDPSDRR